ncbi:CoA-binding protein [Kutzneria chonburiensis]|uniref:CoA-binding protein n=1 Tax=Kutzneria chonburiensis TaxID=1483604 RepID=A0ABV6MY76_9PSEU
MIKDLLSSARTIAVVGLSTQPWKAAHSVPAALKAAGYKVIPVHPSATEILGEKVYRSLLDIPEHVDIVDVFRPADETPAIAEQAVQIKAGALWLQLGIANDQARSIAEAAGLTYIEDRCIAVERSMLGL